MKKFLRRLLFIFIGLIILAICVSIIGTSLFGDKIGKRILSEVNTQITSELTVDRVDISLINGFPNLSVNLHDVVLMDTEAKPLVELKTLSFRLGLLALLRSKIDVKSVLLKDGKVNVAIDPSGKANYLIYENKESESQQKNQQEINLNKAILKNIDVSYANKLDQQAFKGWIEEADLSGQFGANTYALKSRANILTRYIQIEQEHYLSGKEVAYDAEILIENKEDISTYSLKEVALSLEQNTFDVSGMVEQKEEDTYLDIEFNNQSGDLASLLKLLPQDQVGNLEELESSGNLSVEATIKGLMAAGRQPAIRAIIDLDRGKISTPQMGQAFKDVALKATFDNGRRQTNESTVFEIANLTGYFGRNRLDAQLRVENLNDPVLNFSMDGVLPLDAVYGFYDHPKIKDGNGEIIVKNVKLDGRYKDLINPSRISRVKASGVMVFDKATLKVEEEQMMLRSGEFKLEDNYLSIQNLLLDGAGSEIAFDGKAYNVLPVLFADSVNSQRAELEFQATLKAKTIDFDRLIALSQVDEEAIDAPTEKIDSIKEATIKRRERITNFLKGNFDAVVESYNYNKIKGEAFRGQIEFINNEMVIKGTTNAMNGRFDLEGQMFFEDEPRLDAKLVCSAIDMNQFFAQTENFGQDILTSKNVDGDLDAKIAINAYWDEAGNFLYDKLRVLAGIGLQEGYLKNFKMLNQFSSVVNVKDLMNIKFTNLQNFLEYRRNKLYIPAMFIQSNAMNLTVSGEHSYDNEMKYNIKVNASQVLANRFTRHDPKLKPLKARKKGFLNLYYTIFGTTEDYQVKSAKRQVKSDFELSSLRKRDIQLALEEKFGVVNLVEEPEDWRDIPEYTGEEAGEEEEFLDWEIKQDSTRN